jgi:hypothetical protein
MALMETTPAFRSLRIVDPKGSARTSAPACLSVPVAVAGRDQAQSRQHTHDGDAMLAATKGGRYPSSVQLIHRLAAARRTTLRSRGLIACGQCGCSVVGEIKKQRYVYYHCTGYADKCQGNRPPAAASMCARRRLRLSSPTARLLPLRRRGVGLGAGGPARQPRGSEAGAPGGDQRLQAEHARLGERINAMYIDKLDGKIGGDFFDRFAGEWGAAALAA